MIICPTCGKQLEDGSQFCDNCGTQLAMAPAAGLVFCPNCGAQNSGESSFCQSCGAPLYAEAAGEQTGAASRLAKLKPILFGAIGVVAVLLVVFIATRFIGGGGGGGKKAANYALYVKDDEIVYNALSKADPIEVTSRLDDSRSLSDAGMSSLASSLGPHIFLCADGKTMFYPDRVEGDTFALYTRNISKTSEEPTRIDTNVSSYYASDKGDKVYYIKDSGLYLWTGKNGKEKVASDVSYFKVSSDSSKILYKDIDDDLCFWTSKNGKEKINSDVTSIHKWSDDLSTIYYSKDESLYKYAKGDSEKLISNYSSIIRIYDSGEFYYIESEEEAVDLMDYVSDDMASADAAMEAPVRPTAPSRPYTWSYGSDEEYQAALAQYEIDYAAYQAANEQYQADTQAYREKQNRDSLRGSLESRSFTRTTYSLYYYDGSDSVLVSDALAGSSDCTSASESAVMVAPLLDQNEISKVRLSDISSASEVESKVRSALASSSEYYIVIGSGLSSFDQEDVYSFRIASDGSAIYYLDDMDDDIEYGELYQIAISKGSAASPSVYDSDVSTHYTLLSDGSIYYFKDINSHNEGELFFNKSSVALDVYYNRISYDKDIKTLFYYTDYNDERRDGTLNLYDGKNSTKVSDDVRNFLVVKGNNLLFLYDFSDRRYTGTLNLFNGKKTTKIDEDVSGIIRVYDSEARRDYFGW